MKSLYKSPASKDEILALYQKHLDKLELPHSSQNINTSFGSTHVIITGNPNNPPLLLVHGSNGCAPIALDIYPNLSKHFQVFAVDVIAQPNRSSETRPSMKDDSYGKWLHEVITGLELRNVTLVGFSLGGFILWKALSFNLSFNASNIKEAFIIAPIGIVSANPIKAMLKVFLPMQRFIRTGKTKFIDAVIDALFSERDDFAPLFLPKVFKNFDLDFSPIPNITPQEAKTISTPLTIIAAQDDIIAPGGRVLARASKIFPSLKHSLLLENSKHVQSRKDNLVVESIILGDG